MSSGPRASRSLSAHIYTIKVHFLKDSFRGSAFSGAATRVTSAASASIAAFIDAFGVPVGFSASDAPAAPAATGRFNNAIPDIKENTANTITIIIDFDFNFLLSLIFFVAFILFLSFILFISFMSLILFVILLNHMVTLFFDAFPLFVFFTLSVFFYFSYFYLMILF